MQRDPLGVGERFDVVVSNPPYIDEADGPTLAPEVVGWEPARALFAQGAGLAVLSAIIEGARARLEDGGLLALEMGASQGEAVRNAIDSTGAFRDVRIVRDLAGRERMALAKAI